MASSDAAEKRVTPATDPQPSAPHQVDGRGSVPANVLASLSKSFSVAEMTKSVARLDRVLSEKSSLDTSLLTATYTLHLLNALLRRAPLTSTPTPSKPSISPALPSGLVSSARASIALQLLRLSSSLGPLTSILDETRMVLRLWGLLGVWTWAATTYTNPPKDGVLKSIAWAQIVSIAAFQVLENGAYLAGKNVLAWSKQRVGRAWLWSSRFWMMYVGLQLSKLGYEYRLRQTQSSDRLVGEPADAVKEVAESLVVVEGEETEDVQFKKRIDDARQEAKWWRQWRKNLGVNLAYAPMTVHYSSEKGFLGEGSLGLLGCAVAWLSFGDVWAQAA